MPNRLPPPTIRIELTNDDVRGVEAPPTSVGLGLHKDEAAGILDLITGADSLPGGPTLDAPDVGTRFHNLVRPFGRVEWCAIPTDRQLVPVDSPRRQSSGHRRMDMTGTL